MHEKSSKKKKKEKIYLMLMNFGVNDLFSLWAQVPVQSGKAANKCC
jgi:hypothetical protein